MRLKLVIVLICLVAFGIRLGIISNIVDRPGMSYGLSLWHGEAARNIVEGRGFVVDLAYLTEMATKVNDDNYFYDIRDFTPPPNEKFEDVVQLAPGTAWLLSATYLAFGEYRYIYLRILQALIDSFGCLIIFLLCKELFDKRVGLIAAGIYAVFLPIAAVSTTIMLDALMPFLILLSLYLFVMGVRRNSIKYYIMSAVVTGISCYFQQGAFFLPVAYGLGLFIYNVNKIAFWPKLLNAMKVTVVMMAILVAVVSPWIVRNHQVTGVWSANLRVATWGLIWETVGEFPDNPIGAQLSDPYALSVARKELGYDVQFGTAEYDAVFKPKVLNLIKDYPLWCAGALISRVPNSIFYWNPIGIEEHAPKGLTWTDWEFQRNPQVNYIQAIKQGKLFDFIIKRPYDLFYWGIVALFAAIPPIIAFAWAFISRKEWRTSALLLVVPLYFAAIHVVAAGTSGHGKSLLPGAVVFIVLMAAMVAYLYNRYINKKSKDGVQDEGISG